MKMKLGLAESDVEDAELGEGIWFEVESIEAAHQRLDELYSFHQQTRHLTPPTPVIAEG